MGIRALKILVLFILAQPARAQFNYLNLGIEHFGLSVEEPFHSAWSIHQDSLGRLVGYTSEYKNETLTYDGKRFKKETILSSSELMLLESDNGGYWKLSDPFIATFVKGDYEVSLHIRDYLERNICHLYIYEGYHYMLANDGYIKFQMIEDKIQVKEHHKYPVTRIEKAYFTGDTIYINQGPNVAYILQSNPAEIIYTNEEKKGSYFLMNLTKGRVFVPGHGGDRLVQKGSKLYDYLSEHGEYMMNPYIDSKGRLWSNLRRSSAMGLYIFHPDENRHYHIDLGIEKTNILGFFEDNLGDIWVSSSSQGIIHLYDQSIRVLNKSSGLVTDNVSAIYQSNKNGKVYISMSYLGADILDSLAEKKIGQIEPYDSYKSILEDQKGRMWIIAGGVVLIQDDKFIKHYGKPEGFHSRTVTSLFEDSQGDIWAGTRQVLHKYVDDHWKKYQIPDLDVYDRIVGIAELGNRHLLLAIDIGKYFLFDGENFTELDIQNLIPNDLFTDLDGTIWLATENNGLFYWDDNNFKTSSANEHLDVNIKNLQDSDNGLLFGLCSGNKIFYAKKSDLKSSGNAKSILWLTTDSGLPLMEGKRKRQKSTALLNTGEIAFPNVYGAILIDPKKIYSEKQSFQVLAMRNGKAINNTSVHLDYGDNDLKLEICNIYLNPQADYANQIQINKGEWKDVTPNTGIELKNLSSGTNEILLRAKHVNGTWLEPIRFSVFVPPLFYERWWFILGFPIVLFLLIYFYTKFRMRAIQTRNQQLKQQVNKQTQELLIEKKQLAESLIKQKDLTHELNLSQATKNRMYAQISHEFKSPLQAIKAHLSKRVSTIYIEDNNRINANINNLLNISEEIMELSKAESGNLKIKRNWYNINGVISDQIGLKMPLAEEKDIVIEHPAMSERQYLEFDISLMQKVINNLLSNAIKFAPNGSKIKIGSEVNEDEHLIFVSDNGPGIPKNEINNLTQAYYQASNNLEKGTGIGLSLVQEILNLHNSKLQIKSELGLGSTFSFALPRPSISQQEILDQHINPTSIDSQINQIVDKTKPIILAVDDSADVLYFLNQALNSTYALISARNGEEALITLSKIKPHLIISDYNMPVMNGLELLNEVRKLKQHEATPFLFLTGTQSEESAIASIKAGADTILQKPIDEELLLSQVAKSLSRQKTMEASIKSSFAHNLLPPNMQNDDKALIHQLEEIFYANIENGKLKSHDIANLVGFGEKTLRNRVKSITGLTVKEFFKRFRLEKAKLLIEEGYGTRQEVALATGFYSLSNFNKSYKAYFKKIEQGSTKSQ